MPGLDTTRVGCHKYVFNSDATSDVAWRLVARDKRNNEYYMSVHPFFDYFVFSDGMLADSQFIERPNASDSTLPSCSNSSDRLVKLQ